MTKEQWDTLSRKQQLRILRKMGSATAAAMFLTYQQLECILMGFFEGVATMRKLPSPPPTALETPDPEPVAVVSTPTMWFDPWQVGYTVKNGQLSVHYPRRGLDGSTTYGAGLQFDHRPELLRDATSARSVLWSIMLTTEKSH